VRFFIKCLEINIIERLMLASASWIAARHFPFCIGAKFFLYLCIVNYIAAIFSCRAAFYIGAIFS